MSHFTYVEKQTGAVTDNRIWFPRRVVLDKDTGKARVTVIDTAEFGEVFFLDGVVQSTQAEADKYHNLLVRPAMKMREKIGRLLGHPECSSEWSVMILGGGEGITAQKVLEWPQVRAGVIQIDYDEELLRIFDKELPQWSRGVYNDERIHVQVDDAWTAINKMRSYNSKCDVIIIDLTEPAEFGLEKWRNLLDMVADQLSPYGSVAQYASTLVLDKKGRPILSDDDWGAWRVFVNALEGNEKTCKWQPFMYAIPMEGFGGYCLYFIASPASAEGDGWLALEDPENEHLWEEAKAVGKYLMTS